MIQPTSYLPFPHRKLGSDKLVKLDFAKMILWAKILIIFWSTFSGLSGEDLINRMMWSSFPTGLTEVYWWIHSTFSLQLSASRYRIRVHLDLLHHSRPWDVPFVYNLVFFCTVVSQLCRFLWELTPWTNSYWSNSFHCVSLSISRYFQCSMWTSRVKRRRTN